MAIELAEAYVSVLPDTKGFESGIRKAVNNVERNLKIVPKVELPRGAGQQAGQQFMREWFDKAHPMASTFGAALGKAILVNMRAAEAGQQFAHGFNAGAGSIGITHWMANLKKEASASGSVTGFLAGKAMGAAMTASLGAATLGITTVIGGLGAILAKGFERLKALDTAKRQLNAILKSGEQVSDVMQTVQDVVKGTPIALQDAFGNLPLLLSSGVKPGNELKDTLTAIADATAMGNDPKAFTELTEIFARIRGEGKLTLEEVQNQFATAKVPIVPWLVKSLGLDEATVRKMISDGKIGIDQVTAAIEQSAGGMAQKMGDTIEGAMQNTMTAVGRLGADLITAMFGGGDFTKASDNFVEVFKKIQTQLDTLDTWVKAHGPEIQKTVENIGTAISRVFEVASRNVQSFINDLHLLATGLGNILGAMASVDEFLNKIPGMGGSQQEAQTLRQWQQNLTQWGGPGTGPGGTTPPAAMIPGGGGPGAQAQRRGAPPQRINRRWRCWRGRPRWWPTDRRWWRHSHRGAGHRLQRDAQRRVRPRPVGSTAKPHQLRIRIPNSSPQPHVGCLRDLPVPRPRKR